MVDFNPNILPFIDNDIKKSIQMLKKLYENRVTKVVVTPHFCSDKQTVNEFILNRDNSYIELCKCIAKTDKVPSIVMGAEVLLTADLLDLPDINKLCIENTRYILIGLPNIYSSKFVYNALSDLISKRHLLPIIAHVDQYDSIIKHPNILLEILSMEVITQINLSSILNKTSKEFSMKLLKNNMVHLIGYDINNITCENSTVNNICDIIAKKIGNEKFDYFNKNVTNVLNNISFDVPEAVEIKKRTNLILNFISKAENH